MRTKALFVAMLLALAPLPSVAQDLNAGFAAYASGDYAAAVREWKPLAEQGNASAQGHLGSLYANGQGVAQDYAEAMRWYRAAAEQGNASAQGHLGLLYVNGEGVAQDYVTAHMWLNLATANGHPFAAGSRDAVARQMPRADISEAQRRARVCMASNYQDCD